MAKGGSTLAFQLTRAILEAAGHLQPKLRAGVPAEKKINFMQAMTPQLLNPALREIERRQLSLVAIKTHGGVRSCSLKALRRGQMIGQAVARDPRDIALSMLDAAASGGAWGERKGVTKATLEDAMIHVRGHIGRFEEWAAHAEILTLDYERLAFDTEAAAGEIAGQLGVDVDLAACTAQAKARFTQFNKGVPHRHRQEMAAEDIERYSLEFAEFIQRWC
ncbi:MAG: hypothetical protein AAGE18_08280 [Pseudomonadota bacterium]